MSTKFCYLYRTSVQSQLFSKPVNLQHKFPKTILKLPVIVNNLYDLAHLYDYNLKQLFEEHLQVGYVKKRIYNPKLYEMDYA
jgi:hypothetical protein